MIDWINLSGLVEYSKSLKIMEDKLEQIILNKADETIYLLEHHDVYTAGTSYKKEELLENSNIPVIYTGRGGKYTYHGPGQAVIYPLIDLRKTSRKKDVKLYIKNLELAAIDTLREFGIDAYTIDGKVGIWTDHQNTPAKLGAIGVRIKKWVTYHGIAVNINTDLQKYKGIIPCGISDFPVTSLYELGIETSIKNFNSIFKKEFEKIF
ncbi:MAG: lipoyl(octanoyl) transferase LipB [Pseudomonadota bacterium]